MHPSTCSSILLDKLEETLEELKTREAETKPYRARLAVVGSEVDDSGFIKLIEDTGAYVCADRFCFGSLPGRDVIELNDGEDALTQLCRQYVYTRQAIRDQFNVYMRTVMREEPLDPTIEVLPDENAW